MFTWDTNRPWDEREDMVFYHYNGINISSFKSMDEHYFRLTYPNGEEVKYPILKNHYIMEEYNKFSYQIFMDAKSKMRRIKLDSINKKLKR
jgi:thiamine pyrophosphokinase